MKALWNIVALLAIVHVIAAVGGFAMLVQTGKLDRATARVGAALIIEPSGERYARRAELRVPEPEAAVEESDGSPATAEDRLEVRMQLTEADRERMTRLRRSVQDLREQLHQQQALLEAERRAFEDEKAAFTQLRAEINDLEGAEQFRKALEVYEQMKPADTKQVFDALLADGKQAEVVAYLDAIESRIRAKIVSEFVKDEAAPLAAELLEVLRTRGLVPPDPGDTGG